MSEELLPCPFCGEEPFGYEIEAHEHSDALKAIIPGIPDHKGSYVVECACGAGHIDDTKDACVARWNRRAAVDRTSLEAVPDGFEREKWLQKLEDLIDEFGSESRTEAYHGGFHCRRSPEKVREEILSMLSAAPAQPAQQEPDWKDMYEKEKRRSAMWIAKYEKDIGPLDYVVPVAPKEPEQPKCWCKTCRPITLDDMRMVTCPDCGNKRCPKANDHRNACTNSNEPGQPGSAYPSPADEAVPKQHTQQLP